MIRQLLFAIVLSVATEPPARAQSARHHVVLIPVQRGVSLEVLDWGGVGPALVFLAGFGNTAHVFDDFAPQFTNRYHVLAITRRGFGSSSHPTSGYDTDTLARDITTILDSLGIRRAAFAGHSFAGTELSNLGAFHADRVTRLIYLDASYDFAQLYADSRWKRAFPIPKPSAPLTTNVDDLRRWFALVMGPGVPDDEIRFLTSSGAADLSGTLQQGATASALGRIRVPVLALWAAPRSAKDQYPYWKSLDSIGRSRLESSFADQQSVRQVHFDRFKAEVAGARMITVPDGRHYLFLSHPREVVNAMRAFLTTPAKL